MSLSGTKYTKLKLLSLSFGRNNVPSEFKFPDHGLLHLRDILTTDEVQHPNSKDTQGNPICRVLKNGYMTGLTVGGLGKFMSFIQKYFPTGHQESIELPIFNHEDELGTFARRGDCQSAFLWSFLNFHLQQTHTRFTSFSLPFYDLTNHSKINQRQSLPLQ